MTLKSTLKKIWHFLWKEESLASWIVNIILAFIIIKFLLYPGIGWALGTNLPVVAVISESMEHKGTPLCQTTNMNGQCTQYYSDRWSICGKSVYTKGELNFEQYWTTCGSFYTNIKITKEEFENFSMSNGFNKGDIIILKGSNYDNINIGDIIVYQSRLPYPIIHRVITKDDVTGTKGDHNPTQIVDPTGKVNEKYITKDQIIGKAWIKVPYLGWIKIWFSDILGCITFQGCTIE